VQFESPLQLSSPAEFSSVRFGSVTEQSEISVLRWELNNILFHTFASFPDPLKQEAMSIVTGYSGGNGDFFGLFYVPTWSFLHWIPPGSGVTWLHEARVAHALALFIHLWDDHLCDRQLSIDILKLHIRTAAWQRMALTIRTLNLHCVPHIDWFEHCSTRYLTAIHEPRSVQNVDDYCQHFCAEIAIWTMVPYLLGIELDALNGTGVAAALSECIERFSVSWRLLDDIQDIHADVYTNKKSAVWLALTDPGRQLWKDCHLASQERGSLDMETFAVLASFIREDGCQSRLTDLIHLNLQTAIDIATAHGWKEIAYEIAQCKRGVYPHHHDSA
jgi:hypothetical protein